MNAHLCPFWNAQGGHCYSYVDISLPKKEDAAAEKRKVCEHRVSSLSDLTHPLIQNTMLEGPFPSIVLAV
jgi:hypothetical protein